MTGHEGQEGPKRGVGDNLIIYGPDGIILESKHPGFEPGYCVFDYLPKKYRHTIKTLLDLVKKKPNPATFHFEVLHGGKYHPRTAQIWYILDKKQYLCKVTDRQPDKKEIPRFEDRENPTQNYFILSPDGTVEWCKYPEKAPAKPEGVNVFDVILKRYRAKVREVFDRTLENGLEYPIEYGFRLAGEYRYKKGTVVAQAGKLYLSVRRIWHPEEKNGDYP